METSIVDEIKARLDIVDFLSSYLDLKKAGKNYKALCPFHTEKTPSFTVNPERQFFYCFGCGVGGDIITFVMKHESVEFKEALQILAERAGLRYETPAPGARGKRKTLVEIHTLAEEFFKKNLLNCPKARAFLRDRGLEEETINTFSLGYSTEKRDELFKYLRGKGYSKEEILSSGLCKSTEGSVFDTFRRRILFPIRNIRGEVIAFGGRIVSDDSYGPKYLNSPETLIFKKSNELFGLYEAKEEIKKKDYTILVEGYMDVLMAYQHGFRNVVAPLGTALTEAQARKLRTLTNKTLVIFDSDEAGIKAAKRAMGILYREGITAKVLLLPEGEDPDSFLKNRGQQALRDLFKDTKDLVDFYLFVGGEDVNNIRELLEIVAEMKDPLLKGRYIKKLSTRTAISEQFLLEELKTKRQQKMKKAQENPMLGLEEIALGLCAIYPRERERIVEALREESFKDEKNARIFKKIKESPPKSDLNEFLTKEEISYLSAIIMKINIDSSRLEENIRSCIQRLKEKEVREKIRDLQQKIRIAEARRDRDAVMALQSELQLFLKKQGGVTIVRSDRF